MGFKEELQKLSVQVNERMVHIGNEQTTKQSLINPFIQVLAYDVFDPLFSKYNIKDKGSMNQGDDYFEDKSNNE